MTSKLDPNLVPMFRLFEFYASTGERCPTMPQLMKLGIPRVPTPSVLARMGHIMIEVYPHNWRVVTIMIGPHKGEHTQLPADKNWRPYKTIYGAGK